MSEIGKPSRFNVDRYLDSVSDMINADEVERAFWMLDNMPGYYRDHVPERAAEMRERLNRQLWTPVQYKGIYGGVSDQDWSEYMKLLRADLLAKEIKRLNDEGVVPNLMELAPGSFWLPLGLKQQGLNFTYEHRSIDDSRGVYFDPPDNPLVNIFVAFEIIEHLSNELEIYQNYLKFERKADVVMISTPLYTFSGGMDKWETRELGHLRTYTPRELFERVNDMFKGFTWEMLADDTIVAVGRKT